LIEVEEVADSLLKIEGKQITKTLNMYGYNTPDHDIERFKKKVIGMSATNTFDTSFLKGKETNTIIFVLSKKGGVPLTTIVSGDLMTSIIRSVGNQFQYTCSRINVQKIGYVNIGLIRLCVIGRLFNYEDLNQIADQCQ